ncbi:SPOR domain-containing protein [Paenibacillus segetis]|uniref:SPOR domain-containing protein n=1 Tax=Paenibacillus segetis TaxID=1325360 RepID=A0ABQ1Y3S2_9BACL|nr:SPOR domain-containing protein [Paenibacillus segetis]GGH11204.1 hypothetical protein GCM10008013_02920 [Paenibacillus segetis]
MELQEYDNLNIPNNLDDYIDRGIAKGVAHNMKETPPLQKRRNPFRIWGQVAAAVIIGGGLFLTVAANVPVMAKGLENIPVVGNLVKVLDFSHQNAQSGGQVTDGAKVTVGSGTENTIDIHFKINGDSISDVPAYTTKYDKYPYKLTFEFNGVREFDAQAAIEELRSLPYVKDVYSIITLDDSAYRFAVEFSQDVDVSVSEYKEPGMIQVTATAKDNKEAEAKEPAYFIQSGSYEMGESLSILEEYLFSYDAVSIQKDQQGTYIVQMGPFSTEEEAASQLKQIQAEVPDAQDFYIAERAEGKRPASR